MSNKYIFIGNNKIHPDYRDKDGAMCVLSDEVIEIAGNHNWEINQILVEDVDFRFDYWHYQPQSEEELQDAINESYLELPAPPPPKVAVPISKPNTDVANPVKEGERLYSKEDMIKAVQYGFWYATESQHHGEAPLGNIEQWLLYLSSPEFKNNQL